MVTAATLNMSVLEDLLGNGVSIAYIFDVVANGTEQRRVRLGTVRVET